MGKYYPNTNTNLTFPFTKWSKILVYHIGSKFYWDQVCDTVQYKTIVIFAPTIFYEIFVLALSLSGDDHKDHKTVSISRHIDSSPTAPWNVVM